MTARVGGTVPMEAAINSEVTANIAKAELFSMPVLLILLLVIFGSLAAAALPVAIGGIAILGSFAVLRLLTMVTTVSVYSVNITTILGLGLGIDYGLFMVTRFREELHRQPTVEQAVARTVATAGRTVAVSGITVALALTSLMLFPEDFLRSMGFGGVATVAVDMLAALTVLPALLAVLGPRVNALRIRAQRAPARSGRVERRLVPAGAQRHAQARRLRHRDRDRAAGPGRAVPAHLLGRHGRQDAARRRHGPAGVGGAGQPVPGQLHRSDRGARHRGTSARPAHRLPAPDRCHPRRDRRPGDRNQGKRRPHRRRLPAGPGVRGGPAHRHPDPRHHPHPPPRPATPGATVLVGGTTAGLVDELASLGATLPWMALLTGVSTFVLLFLAFGSVVLPLKAIVMNVLSLSATFGVVVWIFQWGHLSRLLQFTPTGSIDPTMPILMLAIIFGLSMDYEVFLLSRIRERYDQTGDNTAAVASGLQRTGGLITSLAVLLIIVVGAFSASGITFIKLMGVGMIVALLVDATIIRVLLVPATMRLLGRANWWAPRPLRRLYARYGINEEIEAERAGARAVRVYGVS